MSDFIEKDSKKYKQMVNDTSKVVCHCWGDILEDAVKVYEDKVEKDIESILLNLCCKKDDK
ncbi:MAG: hypothetical protein U9O94_06235 [Nanoarchaeota archaeon]|nr:hypothetical protein [Nanoarchaeota archaeon]